MSWLLAIVSVLVAVAFFTLLERKFLGYIHTRKGPNKPGMIGLLTPFADAAKLCRKETNFPFLRNKTIYFAVPCISLLIPFLLWTAYPTSYERITFKYSILWFVCVSSIGVYVILGAGWGRNRKYGLLGAVRGVAQSIRYEVRLTLIVLHRIIYYSYSLTQVKIRPLIPFIFLIILGLLVTALAETNRAPFDFSEGESELVRGFNTEFSSVPFMMFFLAEYLSILFISAVISFLFFMTVHVDGYLLMVVYARIFIWRRGTLPRLRYDQLMRFAWKSLLPGVLCTTGVFLTA